MPVTGMSMALFSKYDIDEMPKYGFSECLGKDQNVAGNGAGGWHYPYSEADAF